MVWRSAKKAAVELRPGLDRLPALNELMIAARQLPNAIGSTGFVRRLERHQVGVLRSRLKVVEQPDRLGCTPKRGMDGDVAGHPAVDIDLPPVAQGLDVL